MNHLMLAAPSGIGYPVWRYGEGKPLLLLHGFTGSHNTWDHLIGPFAAGRAVITIDLPGHGGSTLPAGASWTFESVAADVAWIIQSALGGEVDLLGYSMGGRLALACALNHPPVVRRLVLESASPGLPEAQLRAERRQADEKLAAQVVNDGVPRFVESWERLPLWLSQAHLPDSVRGRQREIRLSQEAGGLAASLRTMGTGAQPSYWERLPDLRTPTLLVAGQRDPKFGTIASMMHQRLPRSRCELVVGAGHAVHLEQPGPYVELVAQFLDDQQTRTEQEKGTRHD